MPPSSVAERGPPPDGQPHSRGAVRAERCLSDRSQICFVSRGRPHMLSAQRMLQAVSLQHLSPNYDPRFMSCHVSPAGFSSPSRHTRTLVRSHISLHHLHSPSPQRLFSLGSPLCLLCSISLAHFCYHRSALSNSLQFPSSYDHTGLHRNPPSHVARRPLSLPWFVLMADVILSSAPTNNRAARTAIGGATSIFHSDFGFFAVRACSSAVRITLLHALDVVPDDARDSIVHAHRTHLPLGPSLLIPVYIPVYIRMCMFELASSNLKIPLPTWSAVRTHGSLSNNDRLRTSITSQLRLPLLIFPRLPLAPAPASYWTPTAKQPPRLDS